MNEAIPIIAPLLELDPRLTAFLAAFRDPSLLTFFKGVTLLANWQIILSGGLLAVLLLILWDRRLYVMPFLVSLSGCGLTTSLLKNIVKRPRPFGMSTILTYSFPSGHSAFAACFYGFIFYIMAREFRRGRHKPAAIFCWSSLLSLMMFSRLYLGVHYLSDTLAGATVGTLWLLFGIRLSGRNRRRQPEQAATSRLSPAARKGLTGLCLSLYCLFMALFFFSYSPPYASRVRPGETGSTPTGKSLSAPSSEKAHRHAGGSADFPKLRESIKLLEKST